MGRFLVGFLVDIALGALLLWVGLVIREADLRDVLPVVVWFCMSLAALLAAALRWWDARVGSTDHTNAPHLTWSVVVVRNLKRTTYEVVATCDVTGSLGVLDLEHTWAESTVDLLGVPEPADGAPTTVTRVPETMALPNLSAPLQPGGRFEVNVHCVESDPHPGERLVTWYIAYTDDDGKRGYLSKCSARVAFVGNGFTPHIIGSPALDTHSRRERHRAYRRLVSSKRSAP